MSLSLWRRIHFITALIVGVFLALAAVTGIIIGVANIAHQYSSYKVNDLDKMTLAQSLTGLQENYMELSSISFNPQGEALLKGLDNEGEEVEAYVHPLTGRFLGTVREESPMMKKMISLHRSLELKNVGRATMGVVSFIFFLSLLSGFMLVLQKQGGKFFFHRRATSERFSHYYHTLLGKVFFFFLLITTLTGSYLSYHRFFTSKEATMPEVDYAAQMQYDGEVPMNGSEIPLFKEISLDRVVSVTFPFDVTPEDTYWIKLKDKELVVNQFTGEVLSQRTYPLTERLSTFAMDLHTGRTNIFWATILVFSCVGVLFFIYTGFHIHWSRKGGKVHNQYTPKEATHILLYGSEGGHTLAMAQQVASQLLSQGKKMYLAPLNSYQSYPKGTLLLVFTSTYGVGDAPSNANKFLSLLGGASQEKLSFSVVGFGSDAYPQFCKYAKEVQSALEVQSWASELLPLHTVNNQSVEEFLEWVKAFNSTTSLPLVDIAACYESQQRPLHTMKVLQRTDPVEGEEKTFSLRLSTSAHFTSGDLLSIYPREGVQRLYSIGKVAKEVQLVIRFYPQGIGSNYLYQLQEGDTLQAQILPNPSFHFPKRAHRVLLIANGAGIAPFLGMIDQNKHTEIHLYVGCRYDCAMVATHRRFLEKCQREGKLQASHFIFSKEKNAGYVTDLLKAEASFIKETLAGGGVVMVCGSLSMYQDVSKWISTLTGVSPEKYKAQGQLLVDCY